MERLHILLSYDQTFQEEIFEEFRSQVSDVRLNLVQEVREPAGLYAAYEWLLPTAVGVYIARPYFEAFLSEMGSDHYNLLKKGLLALGKKLIGKKAPTATLIASSPNKISENPQFSQTFSIWAEAQGRVNFKLLIQQDVTPEVCDQLLSGFLNFLSQYHAGNLPGQMKEQLEQYVPAGKIIPLAFNIENKRLELIDPRSIGK